MENEDQNQKSTRQQNAQVPGNVFSSQLMDTNMASMTGSVPVATSGPETSMYINTLFHTTVSSAWGRAIFFTGLGLLVIVIFLVSGPSQWLKILENPLHNPIQFVGAGILALGVVVLPYTGISTLFEKLTIANGQMTVHRPFKTRSVSLLDLASINSRIKAVRGRYGVTYLTYLDISDHTDSHLSIQVHYYKNEDVLARILLLAAAQKQINLSDDTQKTLHEIAGSGQSGVFTPVTESDRMMLRELKQVLIIAAIVLPLIFAYAVYASKHFSAKTAPNTQAASQVATEYMHDLGERNIDGALALESPNLRADGQQVQFLRSTNFNGIDAGKLTDQSTGRTKGKAYVSYVYKYDGYQKPLYIKIALSEYGNDWRVWLFQTSYSTLKA